MACYNATTNDEVFRMCDGCEKLFFCLAQPNQVCPGCGTVNDASE